jgi:hypothetical protein
MMQKYKTLFALMGAIFFISFGALAQISPGTKLLETSLGRHESHFSGFRNQLGFSVLPAAGVVVRENVVAGLSIGVASLGKNSGERKSLGNSSAGTEEYAHSYLAIAPFVRRYFWLDEKLAFQAEFQAGYSWSSSQNFSEYNSASYFQKRDYLNRNQTLFGSFRPGFTYMLSSAVALTATYDALQFGITSLKLKNNHESLNRETGALSRDLSENKSRENFLQGTASLNNFNLGVSFFLTR